MSIRRSSAVELSNGVAAPVDLSAATKQEGLLLQEHGRHGAPDYIGRTAHGPFVHFVEEGGLDTAVTACTFQPHDRPALNCQCGVAPRASEINDRTRHDPRVTEIVIAPIG